MADGPDRGINVSRHTIETSYNGTTKAPRTLTLLCVLYLLRRRGEMPTADQRDIEFICLILTIRHIVSESSGYTFAIYDAANDLMPYILPATLYIFPSRIIIMLLYNV